MSNKETFDYIGNLWEQLNNEVDYSSFALSPNRWIQRSNAIDVL